jgi:glycosyltransferase involved in cell wall biosynthesis
MVRRAVPAHVLLVVDALDGGGAEQHVVDLALALRARGWRVDVACSVVSTSAARDPAPVLARLQAADITVHELVGTLVKRRASPGYALRLRRLVRQLEPNLVHAHIYASEVAAAAALAGSDLPLVLTEHTEAPWRGPAAQAASRRAYRCASAILAVSRAVQRLLVTEYAVPLSRVHVVLPVGAATSRARVSTRVDGPRIDATAADVRATGRTIGFVGRLQPEKGVDVLLHALALVLRRHPTAGTALIGDGPERDRLESLAQSLGIEQTVSFLGFIPDPTTWLRRCDVLAVPSRSDGSPLVVHEALLAGVPVVGSDVGGIPDRLLDGRLGLLVPPGDPVQLAAALDRVLANPILAAELACTGQLHAATLSHAGMVDQVYAIYNTVLAAGNRDRATAPQNLWRTGEV